MRKYYLILLFLGTIGLLIGKSYYVKDFISNIDVNLDGSLNIEESMSYQFDKNPFRWVNRDVRSPRKGFILLEEALIDGKLLKMGSGPGTISLKKSDHLKVKFNLANISDQLVKFTLKYKVYNALVTKGEKAVLAWTPLPDRYKFQIIKGKVIINFPDQIPVSKIVKFLEEVDGVTYKEEGNSLICSFKNLSGESFEIESNLPLDEMQLITYPSPQKSSSLEDSYPNYSSYISLYKFLILGLILFLIYVIFVLIIRYDKQIKKLPKITKLPSHKHPSLVARLLQVGSDDLNLIPVLMHMAIKQLIVFTQMTNKKGKAIKDYYVDIASDLTKADDFDLAYLDLLKKHEERKKKRIELKSLVTNSYKYKKDVLKVINEKFDETGFVDIQKKKKYYQKVIFFFILLIIGVVASILGAIFFTKGFALAPIPAFIIMSYWVYMMLHLDDKVILSSLGYSKWEEWKAFRNYISKALRNKADDLDPNDSELVFPYILIMGYGQQYLRYFKKKNIELNFPNLGEIADDIESLNTLITVVVVTSATSGGGGATSGGGGGGASAG
jgi:Ca2+/Na+ antiporter